MASNSKTYKAFVSSTYIDLKDHRAHVISSLRHAGFFVDPMENWTADSDEPKRFSQERLAGCDVCVLLVAFRQGFVPDGETRSITQLEYDAAVKQGVEILPFLLDENAPWKREFDDRKFNDSGKEDEQTAIAKWRKYLSEKHGRAVFTLAPGSIDIHGALWRWREKKGSGHSKSEKIQRIEWPEGKSPYPGLFSFDLDYAPLFFGRDRHVDAVLAKMSQATGRFLVISGSSGSGKSSLVAAGIRRAVNAGRLPDRNKVVWLRIQPGRGQTPFESLTWPLIDAFPRIAARPSELASQLANNTQTIGRLLDTHLAPGYELLLFVDQLEELFTGSFKDCDAMHFLEALVMSTQGRTSRLRVIGTVRSEFSGRILESEMVVDALNANSIHVLGPMPPKALQAMIEQPAQATGYDFEDGLVDELLCDAAQEPGRLPLMAYALSQLFVQLRDGRRTFTHEAYKTIGRVAGAIGTQANRVLQRLDSDVDAAFGRVFAELVHIERDRPPTGKRTTLSHFKGDEEAAKVIQVLAGPECRVLVTASEGQGASVEVAHDKLFTVWPKLKLWIDESGEALRDIEHAEEEAWRWQKGGDNPQELWLGSRAKKLLTALEQFGKHSSLELQRFLRPQEVLIAKLDHDQLLHQDRLLIGQKLAEFGDTRPGVGLSPDGLPDIVWIEIPGGQVKLEDIDHVFEVNPFRIAKYPVTNAQFEAFLNLEGGYRNKEWWRDIEQRNWAEPPRWPEANAPREMVSWFETVAFCRWLSAKTRTSIRLPTEWEWQQAVTGGDLTHKYPWIGRWDAARCNSDESRLGRTTAVGVYPQGATEQGAMDMAGNVWEWCLNTYEQPEAAEAQGIYRSNTRRMVRGGSWYSKPGALHISARYMPMPAGRDNGVGFRLAQDIP